MRKLIKIILSEVGIEDLKIRPRGDNRCESANRELCVVLFAHIYLRRLARQALAPLALVHEAILGLNSGLKQVLPSITVRLRSVLSTR